MAFADPQAIDVGSGTLSLPRVSTSPTSGTFQVSNGEVKLTVSHAVNKRARRSVRVDVQKVVPDPLFPATNVPRSASVYLVVDAPVTGFTVAELTDIVDGLTTFLSASTSAKTVQLLGGEN